MAALNQVTLIGNLTRDIELRQTGSGIAVADIGLAISEKWRDKEGTLKETVTFVDVILWDRQAHAAAQYLKKGSPVLIEGKLQLDKWTTDQGENRSKLRVKAERLQFLHKAPPRPDQPTEQPEPTPTQQPQATGTPAPHQEGIPF